MDKPLISVIIPVYNVEKYIKECIDSVLGQSYTNIEIILVDDGTKDSSGLICDEYALKDSRIKVIHQENKGLSGARNTGIENATGEYIFFLDSDDSIKTDYISNLYNAISDSDADYVFSDIQSTKLAESESIPKQRIQLDKADVETWLTDSTSREYVLMVVAWNKLYRASLLGNVRFYEGMLHEDEFYANQILRRMKKAVFIPEKGYIYRDNDQGITGKDNSSNIRHLDVIDAYAERIRFAAEDNETQFAKITLSNALHKTYGYSKADKAMAKAATEKLAGLISEFHGLMSIKQRIKYRILLLKTRVST